MSDDLVVRLRSGAICYDIMSTCCRVRDVKSGCVCAEIADEIERLRDKVQALENELQEMGT